MLPKINPTRTGFWEKLKEPWAGYSRRDLFRQGGLLAAAQAFGGSVRQAVAAPLDLGAGMYRSIGVRPVINARGTFNEKYGALLRKTGEFPCWPRYAECRFDALRPYLKTYLNG